MTIGTDDYDVVDDFEDTYAEQEFEEELDYATEMESEDTEQRSFEEVMSDSNLSALADSIDSERPNALNVLAELAIKLQETCNISDAKIRNDVFETYFEGVLSSNKEAMNLILNAETSDTSFIKLVSGLYPLLEAKIFGMTPSVNYAMLVELFSEGLSTVAWGIIDKYTAKKSNQQEFLTELAIRTDTPLLYSTTRIDVKYPSCISIARATDDKFLGALVALSVALFIADESLMPEKVEEEVKSSVTNDDIDNSLREEIDSNVMRILSVYRDLFEVGFELVLPYGIMTQQGYIRLGSNGEIVKSSSASFTELFKLLNSLAKGNLRQNGRVANSITEARNNLVIAENASYYPDFQLANLYGVMADGSMCKTWSSFASYLKPILFDVIKQNLKSGKEVKSVVNALTTCIVISEHDINAGTKLRMSFGGVSVAEKDFSQGYSTIRQNFFSSMGELDMTNRLAKTGVISATIIYNRAAFDGKPLFAYEAIQAMKLRDANLKPSMSNFVLGRDLHGKTLYENFDRNAASVILIGAGPRSGKGVLTLNMLGTCIGDGNPLIYLDAKPDMATLLWDLSRKYNVQSAVYDVYNSNGHAVGGGAPQEISEESKNTFGVLTYLKVLQLMMVATSLSANGKKLSAKRPYFIFDEALAAQIELAVIWPKIYGTAKSKEQSDTVEWCKTVANWVEAIGLKLAGVLNSQLPISGVSTIWLFQAMQPNTWSSYDLKGSTVSKFNILKQPVMSRSSIKILGKGTSDSVYGLSALEGESIISSKVKSETGRHFVLATAQKLSKNLDEVKVFKPYLVLNSSGANDTCVVELLKNVSKDVAEVVAPNGVIHDGVGFEGFANMISPDAISNLALGKKYLNDVMMTTPLAQRGYTDVDDYLFDMSVDSFMSTGALLQDFDSDSTSIDFGNSEDVEVLGDEDTTDVPKSVNNNTFSPKQSYFGNLTNDGALETSDDFGTEEPMTDGQRISFSEPANSTTSRTETVNEPFKNTQRTVNATESQSDRIQSPNDFGKNIRQYNESLEIPDNPFMLFNSNKTMSCYNAIRMMSNYIMDDIRKVFGGAERVDSLQIYQNGLMINGVAYRPKLSDDFVKSLPFDLREQVANGNVVELFELSNIYKFKNLAFLSIQGDRLAEGRGRRELGISPRLGWATLFRKFSYLRELNINGCNITDGVEGDAEYNTKVKPGFDLTEKVRNGFKLNAGRFGGSVLSKLWDSKPARVLTGAVGWTAAVKGIAVISAMTGGWGLVLGAIAGYRYINEYRKPNSGLSFPSKKAEPELEEDSAPKRR